MAKSAILPSDKRCVKTLEAIVKAFFCFYATHPRSEHLSVTALCRLAGISTPTFYRHFRSLLNAAEFGHEVIQLKLTSIVDGNATFFVSLVQVFHFIVNHENYYRASLRQMYALPFEEIQLVLKPTILAHIQKSQKVAYSSDLVEWLCYELENYATLVLRWWISEEVCDVEKIDVYARRIMGHVNQRIAVADRQARMARGGGTKNSRTGGV